MNRRDLLKSGAALVAGSAASAAFRSASAQERAAAATQPPIPAPPGQHYTPVVTLNGSTLPWKMDGTVKVFHLIAEPVRTYPYGSLAAHALSSGQAWQLDGTASTASSWSPTWARSAWPTGS